MHTKETFKKDVESEVRGVQVKLLELRVKAKKARADVRGGYVEHINLLEDKMKKTEHQLNMIDEIDDQHAWEELRHGVEDSWAALQDTLQDAISSFEGHD